MSILLIDLIPSTALLRRIITIGLCLYAWNVRASSSDCRLGLPPAEESLSAPMAVEKRRAALGQRLFRNRELSKDGTVGCVTCHEPNHAFTDGHSQSRGVGGQTGTRNAPSLINVTYAPLTSWDGRRNVLEDQAMAPFTNPREHGLTNTADLFKRLSANETTVRHFRRTFPGEEPPVSEAHIRISLGAYLRTLSAGGSPFDRYYYGREIKALEEKAVEGLGLFTGRAGCTECHLIKDNGALLTDYQFHRIGIGMEQINPRLGTLTQELRRLNGRELDNRIFSDPSVAGLGRFLATRKPADIGRFRTPSLRNVAMTAPYMHDGSIATLPEAVEAELYYQGLKTGKPIALTPSEKQSLVSFLKALTGCIP